MSDLEAAITAEMRRQGCRRLPVGSPIYDYDTCREHLDVWIDTRDACSVVDGAVRAGWDAAINAAAGKAHDEGLRAHSASIKHEPGSPAASRCVGGMGAAFVIRDGIESLLSEGGNRE